MTLSLKHIQVRDFILQFQAQHREKPRLKDVANACGIPLYTVSRYIRRLEKAGELELAYVQPLKTRAAHNS